MDRKSDNPWFFILVFFFIFLPLLRHHRDDYSLEPAYVSGQTLAMGSSATARAVIRNPDWGKNPQATAGNRDIAEALVYQLERGETQNMLSYKRYEGGGVQAVFVRHHRRYTVYWSGAPTSGRGFLSFWVRPNGSWSKNQLLTFTDDGPTGAVSFGIGPGRTDEEKRYYKSFYLPGFAASTDPVHEERFSFWQDRYSVALAAANAVILKDWQ